MQVPEAPGVDWQVVVATATPSGGGGSCITVQLTPSALLSLHPFDRRCFPSSHGAHGHALGELLRTARCLHLSL